MAEVSLYNDHVVIEIKPNFMLDLKRRFATDTLQILIQFCEVDILGETELVIHYTMTYNSSQWIILNGLNL